jgi:YHS domain-containing protein
MHIKPRTLPLSIVMVIFFSIAVPSSSQAKSEIYKTWLGVAIKGYDPVAYHEAGKSVKGSDKYEYEWKGAKWRFASAAHRDLFKGNPHNYAPQYGGYCAWAVSQGTTAGVDPKNAWKIVDGKLYLNYNDDIQEKWSKDIVGNIQKADANWPGVLD